MGTIRLIPSTYAVSNSNYLSVSNASNMYANTDSTTYATVTNSRTSTTSYYLYLRGFNFNDIPSGVTVKSFTVKLKGYESGLNTSTSYAPRLANGTSAISNTTASTNLGTSSQTITIPTGSLTWQNITNYGSNFTITIYVRRSDSNTTGYAYIQGAEIQVEYSIPRTVVTTLNGDGTIEPSGTETYLDDDEYQLIVTPTNPSDEVTATRNGSSITLTKCINIEETESNVLGSYSLISGGFYNNSGATYFQGIVGHGYDTNTTTSSNYYSSGSGTTAVFQYDVGFNNIPSQATIKSVYMMANGHAESTSNSSEYMCVQLKSGSTNLSTQFNFKSAGTSNSTQTIYATTTPTIAQLENLVVECTLGYYGGAINGVTVFVEYELDGTFYTYNTTINENMTIVVTISDATTQKIYVKVNGTWTEFSKIYKKINGSWVEQSDLSNVFVSGMNYIKSS